jgi:diguanylate cyclase (GGDEF)-like protein
MALELDPIGSGRIEFVTGMTEDRSLPKAVAADEVPPSSDSGAADAADPALQGDDGAGLPIADAPVPPPNGWSDGPTGVDGPRYWDRTLLSEQARVKRYRRPATVVMVEVSGLGRLGRLWGADVAERTLGTVARSLAREIRTSDHVARIEPARFGILLTETTEIEAINFIERARVACERDLRLAADICRVGFGWASPPKGQDLTDAVRVALHRLAAELRET